MIVTYSGANVMYLGTGEGQKTYKFTPGVNEVTPTQWKGIQAGIAKRDKLRPGVQSHHDECLCVIGGKEQKDGSVVGPDEVDFIALQWQQAVKLVKGTVDMDQLKEYKAIEDGNDNTRHSVVKAIDAQIAEVKAFHFKVADSKQE